jgi:hypothetical protein
VRRAFSEELYGENTTSDGERAAAPPTLSWNVSGVLNINPHEVEANESPLYQDHSRHHRAAASLIFRAGPARESARSI